MSEQDGLQVTTNQHRSRQISKQNATQKTTLQRPINDDKDAWVAYWKEQGQSWRTEPEIDDERKKFLAERRTITPDIEQGIYSFKDIKLSRADIEWLLATHENGRGPIKWNIDSPRRGEGIDLRGGNLCGVNLRGLPLTCIRAGLNRTEGSVATLGQRNMALVHLQKADLSLTHLEGAYLRNAHLEGADLKGTHLEGAYLKEAHLEGADLKGAHLEGASLRSVFLDSSTNLEDVVLWHEKLGAVLLADVHWGDVNLSVVDWEQIKALGDEYEAQRQEMWEGKQKNEYARTWDYYAAVRTNRQLAVILREQGLNEVAARFAYRAQKLQRAVLRRHRKSGQYLFSLFLDLLTGYGYKPLRSFLAYLLVIAAFATAYFIIGRTVGTSLSPVGSVVFSMTSFHGRGFFPGGIALDDPLTILAALEAFVGLLIEVTFIATLTQRLFGK